MHSIKDDARKLIERLPEDATWDDLMYEFFVTKKIQTALDAVDRGEVVSHEEVKKQFLS